MKILIVDDSPTMRMITQSALKGTNHETFTAVDGLDGLEKVKSESFDLFLIDVNMPKMSGIELLKAIREMGIISPIIILTTDDSHRDEAKSLGATGYMIKPFVPAKLIGLIKHLEG